MLLGSALLLLGCLTACTEQPASQTPTPPGENKTPTEAPTAPTTAPTVLPDVSPEDTLKTPDEVTPTEAPTPVTFAPFERDAKATVADITIGWNLGNTFDAYIAGQSGLSTETCWGNPKTSKELISLVKQLGFNAVRVPVTWGNHMDKNNVIDAAWLSRVAEVVGYVLDNDMYCILNAHHDTGTDGWLRASRTNEAENKAKFAALWTQVADYFSDYSDKLLFESFNELLDDDNHWSGPPQEALTVTNELNQLFVDTVRQSKGNNEKRCLIVNTYAASTDYAAVTKFVLPEDITENRLIAEAHVYAPFFFTHEDYQSTTSFTENEVKSAISPLFVHLGLKGIPVIIGEFGCADKNNDLERTAWTKYYVDTALRYGFKCFWWDNGSQYAVIDRKRNKACEPTIIDAMVTEANGGDYLINQADFEENAKSDNLCHDLTKWGNWIDTASGAVATMSYTDTGIRMTVTNGGKDEWNAQPSYNTITLEQGVSYILSFDYSGSIAQNMSFTIQQNYGDYVSYFTDRIDLEPTTKHYESHFTMTAPTDKNAKVSFNFGASQYSNYTNTVENLSLIPQK